MKRSTLLFIGFVLLFSLPSNIESKRQWNRVCSTPPGKKNCDMPKESGSCKSQKTRYFFNTAVQKCEPFPYNGCGSNGNNYMSQAKCEARCAKDSMLVTEKAPLEQRNQSQV